MTVSPITSMTPEPSVRVETITPDMAREYLAANTHNRPVRHRVVAAYARDIAASKWEWNGESIKFDRNGVLSDGQHRLLAIVEADTPLKMLVIRGLDPLAQETMDGGAKRTFSDVLKLRGEESYTQLAAGVRLIASWESGDIRKSNIQFTNTELVETLERHGWIRNGLTTAKRLQSHAGLPSSIGVLLYWLFTQVDTEDAEFFFARIASSEGHAAGDPAFELRKALLANDDAKSSASRTYLTAISVKAWNKYRAGETVGLLRFRMGGARPEPFPEPK